MTQTKAELLETKHQGDIRLGDANSSHYVGFKAPATVGSNLVWTLPATDGSANQFLQTNASGVLSWGTADTSASMPKTGGVFTGDVTFDGATAGRDIVFDRSDNALEFADNTKATFGSSADLLIEHDGSNSYIQDNGTGSLIITAADQIVFQKGDGSNRVLDLHTTNGTVALKYQGNTKLITSNTGVSITGAVTISTDLTVTGDLTVSGTTTTINTQTLDVEDKNVVIGKVSSPSDTTADGGGWTLKGATDKTFNWVNATDAWTSSEHIHLGDNKELKLGTDQDLKIWHNNSDGHVVSSTGALNLQGSTVQLKTTNGGETYVKGVENGAVELYHDNAKKLETTSGGINVTGAINVNGAALSTAPQITATADGAITAGDTVIVNTNGTVKKAQVLATELGTYTNKTETPSSTVVYDRAITYDENADQIIAVYNNAGQLRATSFAFNSDYSSLDEVTTNQQIWSQEPENLAIGYSPDLQKSLVIWNKFSGSGTVYGSFVTSTASAISDSGATTLASEKHDEPTICYDTANDKFILISNDRTAQQAEYRVISISGSTPSVDSTGTISGASSGSTGHKNKVVYDNTNNRVYLLRGKYAGNSATGGLKLHIGSLSGTTLTWHNTVTVNSGEQDSDYLDMCWMPDINKLAIFYAVSANIKAKVGTPTGSGGTSSMTLGSVHSVIAGNNISCIYDPLLQRAVIFYIRTSDNHGGAKSYSVSGTSFTEEKTWTFANNDINYVSPQTSVTYTKTAQQRVVTSYKAQGNNYRITVDAWKTANTATNLTTENYIGIAANTVANGAAATIDVSGATNSSQSSLTAGQKYYVQNDGSLGVSSATPAVFAGTAISASKLIVNDQQPIPTLPLDEVDEWGQFTGDGNSSYGPWSTSNGQWGNGTNSSRQQGTLTRVSVSGMPKGTGMTNSNGVFTFPSTGKWHITVHMFVQRYDQNQDANITLQLSTNSGSSWLAGPNDTGLCFGTAYIHHSYGTKAIVPLSAIVNVTDKSTYRVRVNVVSGGGNMYMMPGSRITFTKIG